MILLIGELKGEMKNMSATILRLANAFDNLEKGRLSTLEINFAKLQTEVGERSRQTAVRTAAITSIIVGVTVTFLTHFINL